MITVHMEDRFRNKYMKVVREEVILYQWDALNGRLSDTEPSHVIENFRIAAIRLESNSWENQPYSCM